MSRAYQVVEYDPQPFFRYFGEAVSEARRDGDADLNKAIIAKLLWQNRNEQGHSEGYQILHRSSSFSVHKQSKIPSTRCRHR